MRHQSIPVLIPLGLFVLSFVGMLAARPAYAEVNDLRPGSGQAGPESASWVIHLTGLPSLQSKAMPIIS